jgi:hypothetical protein
MVGMGDHLKKEKVDPQISQMIQMSKALIADVLCLANLASPISNHTPCTPFALPHGKVTP